MQSCAQHCISNACGNSRHRLGQLTWWIVLLWVLYFSFQPISVHWRPFQTSLGDGFQCNCCNFIFRHCSNYNRRSDIICKMLPQRWCQCVIWFNSDVFISNTVVMHALCYPHATVNGLLIAEKKKSAKQHRLVDAIPLFHSGHGLTAMVEVAILQVNKNI